jgi:hypothetical protein
MRDPDEEADNDRVNGASYAVGYCRPPVHSRFKPGQSGNPSGRVKGSKNLKSLFHQILNEQIALQDGNQSRKVSKAEAIMRRLIIGALKGDSRSLMTLMRIAEQTGEFENEPSNQPLTIQWLTTCEAAPSENTDLEVLPVIRKLNTE